MIGEICSRIKTLVAARFEAFRGLNSSLPEVFPRDYVFLSRSLVKSDVSWR